MHKLISVLVGMVVASSLAACAEPPAKPVAGQETQRSHAHEAQDELSTEVHK